MEVSLIGYPIVYSVRLMARALRVLSRPTCAYLGLAHNLVYGGSARKSYFLDHLAPHILPARRTGLVVR